MWVTQEHLQSCTLNACCPAMTPRSPKPQASTGGKAGLEADCQLVYVIDAPPQEEPLSNSIANNEDWGTQKKTSS